MKEQFNIKGIKTRDDKVQFQALFAQDQYCEFSKPHEKNQKSFCGGVGVIPSVLNFFILDKGRICPEIIFFFANYMQQT